MLRQRFNPIRMQLFVRDSDTDRAGDICVAFAEKLQAQLDNDLTLAIGGVPSCTLWRDFRWDVKVLTWNGLDYMGLDAFIEIVFGGEVPGT